MGVSWAKLLAGKRAVAGDHSHPGRREPLRVSVGSNLFGVALRLPEPLTKSPYEPANFRLDFVFSESDRLM
ncbi:MAG: hypothetical protein CM1200mP36_01820 [Gammaproteobacteria bacterium]|nr:MAG: hypothetical protein CM1200mP36_01820 [Gammaproteobacteria bacterium]